VIVIALSALFARHPSLLFRLFDPAGAQERHQRRELHALATAETPLTAAEAREQFDRYVAGEQAASMVLIHQDRNHGLPTDFLEDLVSELVDGRDGSASVIYLIGQLAENRPFDRRVEAALANRIRTATGGVDTLAIAALGNIGVHRPLADPTLGVLLDVALEQRSADRAALATIEKTAGPFGLPEWALDRLEKIVDERPGPVRSDAIAVMAAAGAHERAFAIVDRGGAGTIGAGAVEATLAEADLTRLIATLEDDSLNLDLRKGALNHLIRRRDRSELVGRAFTYALSSEQKALRLAALDGYSEYGRHHSRHIDLAWHEFCAAAFGDEDESVRIRIASIFRFIPFDNITARDAFLLDMLAGDEAQQLTALRAISSTPSITDPVKAAVTSLVDSDDPTIAATATTLAERYRPRGRFEGLGSRLAGTLFWALLLAPALTAVGFATYFVARLLQELAGGTRRLAAAAVSFVWFGSSVALGLALFAGVLGFGHGGRLSAGVYGVLAILDAVFFGLGCLLALAVRKPQKAPG
jgi:hypothetical protein